jgi:membrane carboxypeptidase/penicillin-binding protein PbpC
MWGARTSTRSAGAGERAAILRSPGSALKPFLYALALQIGRITPKDMVYDLPRDWSGFKPANFEGLPAGPPGRGRVGAILNLPAVWLEASLRRENGGLSTWMKSTGFTTQGREHIDPGLSLVLGAYPMTLEEMASLYALLARGGILDAVRLSPTSLPLGGSDRRFLTPEPVTWSRRCWPRSSDPTYPPRGSSRPTTPRSRSRRALPSDIGTPGVAPTPPVTPWRSGWATPTRAGARP